MTLTMTRKKKDVDVGGSGTAVVSLLFFLAYIPNMDQHAHTLQTRADIAVGPSKVHVHTSRNKLQPDQHEPLEAKQTFAAKQTALRSKSGQSVCLSVSSGERLMSRARPNDASSEIMASHQPASLLTEPCPGSSTVCNFPPSDKGLTCPLGAHRYKLTCL